MLKYPCLVLDHDDTVVQSEATVNFPYFCEILHKLRPGTSITLNTYMEGCYNLGFPEMCRKLYSFSEQELELEHIGWKAYVSKHIPLAYPGIERIILQQKSLGGLICVVSNSGRKNIIRDYQHYFQTLPDEIFSWESPPLHRKPNPYPLFYIMEKYKLTPDQLLVIDDMKSAFYMCQAAHVALGFSAWSRKDFPMISSEMEKLCDYSFPTVSSLEHFLFEN